MKKSKILAAAMALAMTVPMTLTGYAADSDAVKCDVNQDGEFNLSDMVTFNKWILGRGELADSAAADANEDGELNIFDYVEMRRVLLSGINQWAQPMDNAEVRNLCQGIKPSEKEDAEADEQFILGQTEFALELLKNTAEEGENTLVSPYSVMQALAMTANGADGTTKEEMEKVLGGMPIEELNKYLRTQRLSQPSIDGCKVNVTNSIWTNNEIFRPSAEFIQANVDFFDSEVFATPFNNDAMNAINGWVNKKTDGMIDKILTELSKNSTAVLVNTVTFDSEWAVTYYEDDVFDGIFTSAEGKEQEVGMLSSTENVYLKTDDAVGFMKPYIGGRYSFAALLPDEDTTPEELIDSFTAESFNTMINEKDRFKKVHVLMPKFKAEYSQELSNVLSDMGMPTAFSEELADFSKMNATGEPDSYIGEVQHKTALELTEKGTKAAAATAVVMTEKTAVSMDEYVRLDRPFVYFIMDNETSLPLFIGTMNSIEQ